MRRPIASRRESAEQPFKYPLERAYAEPDWTRLPGYRAVSREDWESALWQRKNTVKNLAELKEALGKFLPDDLALSMERDIRERATMSMLITPHMINTMEENDLWGDPLRRYMLPAFDDRRTDWPSHPKASRDSLHEAEMWRVEGLTHRYPTKVLAEMLSTCPQHFLQDKVLEALDRLAHKAFERGVSLALHTHINHANQVTPLLGKAAKKLLEMGFRDVRNQGVLLRGVNDSQKALLELCFMLQDHAHIVPYYFYMCDMIPNSEHWRLSVAEAQALQHDIMGYLPGFATPRIVCDVPFVGKRWVHQVAEYDRERGISYWTKNYLTGLEMNDAAALTRRYEYYDPIYLLPESGQRWWREQARAA